jgi:hypothetical protein
VEPSDGPFLCSARFLALALLAIFVTRFNDGPIGGRSARASASARQWADWSFGADAWSLELDPERPRSVTTWLLVRNSQLFIPSGVAAWKRWPSRVVRDGRVVVRLDGKLYALQASGVADRTVLSDLARLVHEKYGVTDEVPFESSWYFLLAPRS